MTSNLLLKLQGSKNSTSYNIDIVYCTLQCTDSRRILMVLMCSAVELLRGDVLLHFIFTGRN